MKPLPLLIHYPTLHEQIILQYALVTVTMDSNNTLDYTTSRCDIKLRVCICVVQTELCIASILCLFAGSVCEHNI